MRQFAIQVTTRQGLGRPDRDTPVALTHASAHACDPASAGTVSEQTQPGSSEELFHLDFPVNEKVPLV